MIEAFQLAGGCAAAPPARGDTYEHEESSELTGWNSRCCARTRDSDRDKGLNLDLNPLLGEMKRSHLDDLTQEHVAAPN